MSKRKLSEVAEDGNSDQLVNSKKKNEIFGNTLENVKLQTRTSLRVLSNKTRKDNNNVAGEGEFDGKEEDEVLVSSVAETEDIGLEKRIRISEQASIEEKTKNKRKLSEGPDEGNIDSLVNGKKKSGKKDGPEDNGSSPENFIQTRTSLRVLSNKTRKDNCNILGEGDFDGQEEDELHVNSVSEIEDKRLDKRARSAEQTSLEDKSKNRRKLSEALDEGNIDSLVNGKKKSSKKDGPEDMGSSPENVIQTRTSLRVLSNKTRKDNNHASSVLGDLDFDSQEEEEIPTEAEEKKRTRTWEQWSTEDKNIFFEALNEFGKNFDLIQNHFRSKLSKRPDRLLKTKEQIRYFYYRTWHKISKYIEFPSELKKSSRELYGLINYGEMRKKFIRLDEKNGLKLQELVFNGHTSLRVKGRTHRVRTPVCRALKRLNNKLDKTKSASAGSQTASALPAKIGVELKPLKRQDFVRVHADCLQNPHVVINVADPAVRLNVVLEHLERKWRPNEENIKASLKHIINNVNGGNKSTTGEQELILCTAPGVKVVEPVLTTMEPVTSASLSLMTLQKKMNGTYKMDDGEAAAASINEDEKPQKKKNLIEENKEWNKVASEGITLGELYLMLAPKGPNVELCYTWKTVREIKLDGLIEEPKKSVVGCLARMANFELESRKKTNNAANGGTLGSPVVNKGMLSPKLPNSPVETKSPTANGDEAFLRPSDPPPAQLTQQEKFRQQLQNMLPKATNRKGRPLSRKSFISRQLLPQRSLLPQMKMKPFPIPQQQQQQQQQQQPQFVRIMPHNAIPKASPPTISIPDHHQPVHLTQRALSPTGSISSIFNSEHSNSSHKASEPFLDSVLENSSNSSVLQTPPRIHRPTPPSSPSRAVTNSTVYPWLSSDVEFSPLSSFLHIGETSSSSTSKSNKGGKSAKSLNEDSMQSTNSEVDRQLQLMMTENSLDFTMKFAKLASHVGGDETADS